MRRQLRRNRVGNGSILWKFHGKRSVTLAVCVWQRRVCFAGTRKLLKNINPTRAVRFFTGNKKKKKRPETTIK